MVIEECYMPLVQYYLESLHLGNLVSPKQSPCLICVFDRHFERTLYSRRPLKGTGVSIYLSIYLCI